LRFARLEDIKWRRDECVRNTLPRAVILKRFATALRVLLRAIDFGIAHESNSRARNHKLFIVGRLCQTPELTFHRVAGGHRAT
jgi:hypothetical protein